MKLLLVALALLVTRSTLAQDQPQQQQTEAPPGNQLPSLPGSSQQWINSLPMTAEILKDKAVVFVYFEETSPEVEKRWPELLELSRKYEGKPMLFIAVNSGTPRQPLELYARRHKIVWPILVDPDRSFEERSGIGEINTQNRLQVRGLSGDGEFTPSRGGEVKEVAEAIADSGKWQVDPEEVPAALQAAWKAIEFGNFSLAAQTLKKNVGSSKEEIKTAAEKLQAIVDTQIQADVERAATAKEAGENWAAYKLLSDLQARFRGFTLPASVAADLKELKDDDQVKKELTAGKAFDTLKQKVSGGKFPPKSVRAQMEKFLEQHPGTEAAAEVSAAVARIDGGTGGAASSDPGNANSAEKK